MPVIKEPNRRTISISRRMVACKDFCGKIGERGLENHSSGQFLADLSVILERSGKLNFNYSI